MKESQPTVSVIIPNYNRASLIGQTLDNMLAQTLAPHEIIVVDDGSTDDSLKVLKKYGDKIKLIVQENKGPGAARNAGLKIATGEFIQFMDSDDLFSLNKLEVQAKSLLATKCDIVFSPWAKIWIDDEIAVFQDHVLQNKLPSSYLPLLDWFLRNWSTVFQSFLIKHSFLKKVGFYRDDLLPHEDSEFFVRILLKNPATTFTKDCLTIYRLHNFAKISGDGTDTIKKLIDRANFLRYALQDISEARYKPSYFTMWFLKSEIYKISDELKLVKELPKDLTFFFKHQVSSFTIPFYKAFLFSLRVQLFIRNKITGSRWRSYYKSDYPALYQKRMVEELKFKVKGV